VDMDKRSHTIAAIAATTGEMLGDKTVSVGVRGVGRVLRWARGLGRDRVWALEDCRQVSGSFERFLIARGERVVRVPTRLMAGSRRSSRECGRSDLIDALAVARAALAEGLQRLPTAELAGPGLDIGLVVDHRERLVGHGWRSITRCSGTCTTSGPSSSCPAAACSRASAAPASRGAWRAPSRRCACASPATSCAVCAS
jgi:transposase